MDNELVYFDRDDGVTGARLDLYPRVRYNLLARDGSCRPSLGFRSTAYELSGADDSSQSRGMPILSVDSGMIFERRLNSGRVQTLEPRLYYLYVALSEPGRFADLRYARTDLRFQPIVQRQPIQRAGPPG